jgi:hypothetical protein
MGKVIPARRPLELQIYFFGGAALEGQSLVEKVLEAVIGAHELAEHFRTGEKNCLAPRTIGAPYPSRPPQMEALKG